MNFGGAYCMGLQGQFCTHVFMVQDPKSLVRLRLTLLVGDYEETHL